MSISIQTFRMVGRFASKGKLVNFRVSPLTYCQTSCVALLHRNVSTSTKQEADASQAKNIEHAVKENLQNAREGKFDQITHPEQLQHFRNTNYVKPIDPIGTKPGEPLPGKVALPHPIWSDAEVENIEITHKKPEGIVDNLALFAVKSVRTMFDLATGYYKKNKSERIWVNRLVFLETVAGVPGMVAAMTRHLHSLRRMRRDHGWIHTLLEEAENERMHLMTFLHIRQPGIMFRTSVLMAQGVFVTSFSLAYLISPRFCHRFVGYLEEEAVVTYTKLLEEMNTGGMQHWRDKQAPELAVRYWALPKDSTMVEVIKAIRADEAHHRVVNHTLGSMKEDDYNPYKPGQ